MHKFFLLLLIALLTAAADFPPKPTATTPLPFRAGKDYALFFAVNDYDQWPDLANPVSEVEAVAKDLRELYGFETEIVRNPDRKMILDKIEAYRKKSYDPDAQLLLFFSGHGEFNEDSKQGYFVPKNGLKDDNYGDSYLEYEGLKRRISSLSCPHILLALDACYSGTADEGIAMRGDPGTRPGANEDAARQRYISSSLQYKSRIMLTSGAKVRTPDKSAFVAKFLEALRSQGGSDGLVNLPELMGYVSTALPQPVLNKFGDHEPGGEFLFISQNIPSATPIVIVSDDDESAWQNVKLIDLEESYNSYLRLFRKGRHRAEATAAIDRIHLNQRSKTFSSLDPFYDRIILVEGGVYEMGCRISPDQTCTDAELPVHKVEINSFYLGKYEVTQREWVQMMEEKISDSTSYCPDCPMVNVSWDMIQEFLARVNRQTTTTYYRLPTEAEWEYAARGGAKTKGYSFAGGEDLNLVAWHDGNSGGNFHPVGQKLPNELGLYDMSGNVCEWCQDKWHGNYQGAPTDGKSWVQDGTNGRVFRGGCWNRHYLRCNTSARYWDYPHSKFDNVGFRLARSK